MNNYQERIIRINVYEMKLNWSEIKFIGEKLQWLRRQFSE